jgi:GH15 family glucan-1,4-alpha-glucosidase
VRFLGARARQIHINHQYSLYQTASPLLPVYTIEGEPPKPERLLPHLGFTGAVSDRKPVVVGNNAYQHLQLDIFGELMDALYVFNEWGRPISYGAANPAHSCISCFISDSNLILERQMAGSI